MKYRVMRFFPAAFLLLIFVGLMPDSALAQRQQRFKAGIVAGLTASQIDGDESAGYHKVGLQGGLRGVIILGGKQDASVEILYTQRGCRNQPKTFPEFSTTLGYIEVPVQWHYKDWLMEGEGNAPDWYRMQFNIGLSYGRLLNSQDKFNDGFGIFSALPDLEKNSFCFLVGATFNASPHLGFTVRLHRGLNKLYQPGDGKNYRSQLIEHFLAFQAVYMF